MLSDWSDEDPNAIYAKLKKMSGYYNFAERTADYARAEGASIEDGQFVFGVRAWF
jgi:uncharacterized protein involved in copper resistance